MYYSKDDYPNDEDEGFIFHLIKIALIPEFNFDLEVTSSTQKIIEKELFKKNARRKRFLSFQTCDYLQAYIAIDSIQTLSSKESQSHGAAFQLMTLGDAVIYLKNVDGPLNITAFDRYELEESLRGDGGDFVKFFINENELMTVRTDTIIALFFTLED